MVTLCEGGGGSVGGSVDPIAGVVLTTSGAGLVGRGPSGPTGSVKDFGADWATAAGSGAGSLVDFGEGLGVALAIAAGSGEGSGAGPEGSMPEFPGGWKMVDFDSEGPEGAEGAGDASAN